MGTINPPEPLSDKHNVTQFSSGNNSLDGWFRSKAKKNERGGGARTQVLCEGKRVIGFYSLAASSIEHSRASGKLKRNMPAPIPVVLLGQFAVDKDYQGQGIGSDLLSDALKRAAAASVHIGARAVLLHAIDSKAMAFYEKYGFMPLSEKEPSMLYLLISDIEASLG